MNDILKLGDKMVAIDIKKKPEPEIDWDYERREEARLDAMFDARYEREDDDE
jgi:hypothetical protein